LDHNGAAPAQYYYDHLEGAIRRLNTVVENFNLHGTGVARLQPKFCFDHPEYCVNYTNFYFPKAHDSELMV